MLSFEVLQFSQYLFFILKGDLKKVTIEKKSEYVSQDERLPMLFQHFKDSGAKTFLLTNSEWWYTDAVRNA